MLPRPSVQPMRCWITAGQGDIVASLALLSFPRTMDFRLARPAGRFGQSPRDSRYWARFRSLGSVSPSFWSFARSTPCR
jgi:hypothetical protein